ncbi:hypothetical protein BDR26DRAFT_941068 [Obelidium mucronatum]|nr:hypothetical protein BDR26DRAFT_941068 [Obelidium mucronatum]
MSTRGDDTNKQHNQPYTTLEPIHPDTAQLLNLLSEAVAAAERLPQTKTFQNDDPPWVTPGMSRHPNLSSIRREPSTDIDDAASEADWQALMGDKTRVVTPRHSTRAVPHQRTTYSPPHRLPSGRVLGGVSYTPRFRPAVRLPAGSVLGGPPEDFTTPHQNHQHNRPEAEVELEGTTLVVKKKESDMDILRAFVPYVNQQLPLLMTNKWIPSYSEHRSAVFATLQEYRDWIKLYPAILPHLHNTAAYGAPVLEQLRPLTRALQFPLQLELILRKLVPPFELYVETRYLDDVDRLYSRVLDFPVTTDAALRKYAVRHGTPVAISTGQSWTTAMTHITDIEDAILFDEFGPITTMDNKEYIHQGISLIEANSNCPFQEFCKWDLKHFANLFILNWIHENALFGKYVEFTTRTPRGSSTVYQVGNTPDNLIHLKLQANVNMQRPGEPCSATVQVAEVFEAVLPVIDC